jgi:hypothetical protein
MLKTMGDIGLARRGRICGCPIPDRAVRKAKGNLAELRGREGGTHIPDTDEEKFQVLAT